MCINYSIQTYSLKSCCPLKMSSAIPISLKSPIESSKASNISSLCTRDIGAIENSNYTYAIPYHLTPMDYPKLNNSKTIKILTYKAVYAKRLIFMLGIEIKQK